MTKNLKKILVSSFVLLLIAFAVAFYLFTEKFTDTLERKASYTLNAMDLIKEFQQNDSLANKKYTEKIVLINGTISELVTADTSANIKFIDTATGDYIIFAFQQQHVAEANRLKKGDNISIKGSCSGGNYSEILGTRYITFKRAALN
ncbi:MAG: hypothetical protein ABIO04_09305 [Ferruginibacter sp.]